MDITKPLPTKPLTAAQQRLLKEIKAHGGDQEYGAEYWPVMNDWVKDAGPAKALAHRNIVRATDAILATGLVVLDEDGNFRLTEKAGR